MSRSDGVSRRRGALELLRPALAQLFEDLGDFFIRAQAVRSISAGHRWALIFPVGPVAVCLFRGRF